MTVALVDNTDGTIAFGHVGDSRAYRVRGGELEQLTDDHSLVGELVRSGRLSPEEAESHPQRSVITRALGTEPDVDVDTFTVEAEPGDIYLLCSDGLTDMISTRDILAAVEASDDLDDAARALVEAANAGGGEDNITVVLFQIGRRRTSSAQTAQMPGCRPEPGRRRGHALAARCRARRRHGRDSRRRRRGAPAAGGSRGAQAGPSRAAGSCRSCVLIVLLVALIALAALGADPLSLQKP